MRGVADVEVTTLPIASPQGGQQRKACSSHGIGIIQHLGFAAGSRLEAVGTRHRVATTAIAIPPSTATAAATTVSAASRAAAPTTTCITRTITVASTASSQRGQQQQARSAACHLSILFHLYKLSLNNEVCRPVRLHLPDSRKHLPNAIPLSRGVSVTAFDSKY